MFCLRDWHIHQNLDTPDHGLQLHLHSHLLVGGGASGHVEPRLEIEDPTLPAHTPRPETTEIRAARFGLPTTGLCPL